MKRVMDSGMVLSVEGSLCLCYELESTAAAQSDSRLDTSLGHWLGISDISKKLTATQCLACCPMLEVLLNGVANYECKLCSK